jgi:cytochrome c oxidase accessory protein FixG
LLDARPVRGKFRHLRWWANLALIVILFATPWIRIAGEPLLLLDIPARKFHVFGLVIFPQELYFLWLIIAGVTAGLFFFTALLGRLWCGWACPQTVFTDVYAAVARGIQGWKGFGRPARVARWRLVATHAVWIALSWIIGFHLVGYFRSPYDLIGSFFRDGQVYPTTAAFHAAITIVAYLDFAVIRQAFCKYLCPYARLQGVLFDRDTLVIGYDEARGEPRGKRGTTDGDCVNCRLCVTVCPTGIDIRDGLQLECIACTQCIDACNGVMASLGRNENLIGYRSLVGLEGLRPARLMRPRIVAYAVMLLVIGVVFTTALGRRRCMDLQVSHNPTQLFMTTADGRIGNSFRLRIENRSRADRSYRLSLRQHEEFELVAGLNPIDVPAISDVNTRVFVIPKVGTQVTSPKIDFILESTDGSERPLERKSRYLQPGIHGG